MSSSSLVLSDIRQQMRETKALETLAEAYVSEIITDHARGLNWELHIHPSVV